MSRGKLIAIVVVAALAVFVAWRLLGQGAADKGRRGSEGDDSPIPVTAVAATTQDFPLYLTALGPVQALNTVTVSAQVSGQLQAVHFAERQ
ncbi:MAG: efflux RND transporter periplasmic adaptor subunit, partial [Xanthomonadales bacterium]|nr:efflux RND transporter periplasmic adaptor subunit [Xanthomonadales bacterium]